MKDLRGEKSNTRMDCHLKDVRTQQKRLLDMVDKIEDTSSKMEPIPQNSFTISSSHKLLADIKRNFRELEKKRPKIVRRSNYKLRNSLRLRMKNFTRVYFQTRKLLVIIS